MFKFIFFLSLFCLCLGRSNSFNLLKILKNVKENVDKKANEVKELAVKDLKKFGDIVKENTFIAEREASKGLKRFGEVVKENVLNAEKKVSKDLKKFEEIVKENTIKAEKEAAKGLIKFGEIVKENTVKAENEVEKDLKKFGEIVKENTIRAEKEVAKNFKKFGAIIKEKTIKAENKVGKDLKKFGEIVKENTIKAVKEVVKEIQKVEEVFKDWKFKENCTCQNYLCGCYLHLEIPQISLNNTGRLSVSYLKDEFGFDFLFALDGYVIFDKKVSVKNPPVLCAGGPFVHHLARLCFRFYDLDYKDKHLTGCAAIDSELELVIVKTIELGCFKMPTFF